MMMIGLMFFVFEKSNLDFFCELWEAVGVDSRSFM